MRWWCVLRYYRPRQLALRLLRLAQDRAMRKSWQRCLSGQIRQPAVLREPSGVPSIARRKLSWREGRQASLAAGRILEDRYGFLHEERHLPGPVDWRLESWPDAPHLWRFHLHYHEFLLDLAAEAANGDHSACSQKAWSLVTDWIEHNRLDDPRVLRDAWHPYCISRRLPVWMCLWSVAPPEPALQSVVLASMFRQAHYLAHHLERDLGGNHLLENARALAIAGAFFAGAQADGWLHKAAAILRVELPEQILEHGEHFERSPMYHAQMLEVLLDIAEALRSLRPETAALCRQTATKMAQFLRNILHPDGQIPLLGDSTLGETGALGNLLAWAEQFGSASPSGIGVPAAQQPASSSARIVGDYWVYRSGEDYLLLDAGPVGPDHLPAHAHADLLTIEASVRGQRLLVDSGVFSYRDDPMRQYCRSTPAHNVLQIDSADQCDMWSRFRMGQRGWPTACERGQTGDFAWARAQHNAYRRLGATTVGRWLAGCPGGPWFCIDRVQGTGRHELVSWLHFHPDVSVAPIGATELQLVVGDLPLRLRWLTEGQMTLADGWYCPQLGQRQRAPVVRWEAAGPLPAVCGWCLLWPGREGIASLETSTDDTTVLHWTDATRKTHFLPWGRSLLT
jgi:uncharacterized heparinase superfamily protein